MPLADVSRPSSGERVVTVLHRASGQVRAARHERTFRPAAVARRSHRRRTGRTSSEPCADVLNASTGTWEMCT